MTLLKEVLKMHVVSGNVMSMSLSNNKMLQAMGGNMLRANIYMHGKTLITVNGAVVESFDHRASNGVVHIIDRVIEFKSTHNIVELLKNIPEFSILSKAITVAGLESTLSGMGPFTLFAPTNEAFDSLPYGMLDYLLKHTVPLKDVLLYHVVDGCFFSRGFPDGPVESMFVGEDLFIKHSPG
ncbi:transforming growth factor-beta-induced protein ig-h3-like [Glandiceps talaboti]